MSHDRLLTMLEQYRQEGRDINALYDDYTALAAAGKTLLGLNQWVKSDKPMMEDFNEDNRVIDEKLRELSTKTAVPEEKDLPLAAGISAPRKSYYYQKANRETYLHVDVKSSDGAFDLGQTIATLPAGARPRYEHVEPAIFVSNTTPYAIGNVVVKPNGDIAVSFSGGNPDQVRFSTCFIGY